MIDISLKKRFRPEKQQNPLLPWIVTNFRKISHRFWEICHQFLGNPSPTLGTSTTDFGDINHRLWGNLSPILGILEIRHRLWEKSATDFVKICHRLWEKSATNFGKICHRLWENQPQTLGKSVTDFGKICHGFCEAPLLGKTGSVLG